MKDLDNVLLSELKYIPTKYVNILKKEGIETVSELLLHYPNKFDDYTIINMKDVKPETLVTINGICQSKANVCTIKSNLNVMNFFIDADGRNIKVSIFNRMFLKSKIAYGVYVRLTGKLKEDMKTFVASEIHFDELSDPINPVFNFPKISDAKMLEFKRKVYESFEDYIYDFIPEKIRNDYDIISMKRALKYINIPEDMEEVSMAIKRIKFEELLVYQLKIKYMLYMRKNFPNGVSIDYDEKTVLDFINNLPFKLTTDQQNCTEKILNDIKMPYKMNRLLQGEVGSGKTIVCAIALLAVVTKNYQGALMVPTEVLCTQHYETFINLFKDFKVCGREIKIAKLSSSLSTKEKNQILTMLLDGSIDIIIGTHSLFSKDVCFKNLGLVVTDEEHRFGVKQRLSIVGKGYLIDHLKMSATPIPRTLAISVLGEYDFSTIKTLPNNRKDVITKYINYENKSIVYEHIKKQLQANHQIYVVCPAIQDSALDLKNATQVYEKMQKYYDGICTVGLIHSKLKKEEKEEVMENFSNGKIQILVSTSVIEVGVNVLNATTIVILDADRFGIAQLHQMRGRVRRSSHDAFCFLISDSNTKTSIDRLKLVESTSDGFILSEHDLQTRGPGDFFGEKQTGNVLFKMADLVLDKEILETVNTLCDKIIDEKLLFNCDEYKKLYNIVNDNYIKNKEMLE